MEEISLSNIVPDFKSQKLHFDKEKGEDKLNIKLTTNAIADSIAKKDLETPYTVAILGSWGTGKFFAKNAIIEKLHEIQEHDLTNIPTKPNTSDVMDYPYICHIFIR